MAAALLPQGRRPAGALLAKLRHCLRHLLVIARLPANSLFHDATGLGLHFEGLPTGFVLNLARALNAVLECGMAIYQRNARMAVPEELLHSRPQHCCELARWRRDVHRRIRHLQFRLRCVLLPDL